MSEKGFRMGEGDWVCSDLECANVNFARRTHCNRCGSEKVESTADGKRKLGHEIGTAAAAKSHGLFSADDWQCSKCANVNWARRQSCNVCNAARFGEIEERTGLGGGFNDRGVVEYKRREDSDDEFDEFGRRRKKRRSNSEREDDKCAKVGEGEKVEEAKEEAEEEEDGDEEDEEEEDDDGDLSKYDLSDWTDEKK